MQESGGRKIYGKFIMNFLYLEETLMSLMPTPLMANLVIFILAQNQVLIFRYIYVYIPIYVPFCSMSLIQF